MYPYIDLESMAYIRHRTPSRTLSTLRQPQPEPLNGHRMEGQTAFLGGDSPLRGDLDGRRQPTRGAHCESGVRCLKGTGTGGRYLEPRAEWPTPSRVSRGRVVPA